MFGGWRFNLAAAVVWACVCAAPAALRGDDEEIRKRA
jgi:hypothetical protein